jgi:hypothetical protein
MESQPTDLDQSAWNALVYDNTMGAHAHDLRVCECVCVGFVYWCLMVEVVFFQIVTVDCWLFCDGFVIV